MRLHLLTMLNVARRDHVRSFRRFYKTSGGSRAVIPPVQIVKYRGSFSTMADPRTKKHRPEGRCSLKNMKNKMVLLGFMWEKN